MSRTDAQEFGARVSQTATRQFKASMSTEEGKKAAQRIVMAFLSAMRTARDPSAFLKVTEASVADCVATSHDTNLYPGGPNPTVYLVPQAPRKNAQPELQWRITHRGLAILANRAGYGLLAVPVSLDDKLKISYGEVVEHETSPESWPTKLDEILGMIVVVRRLDDGITIARIWAPRGLIEQRRRKARTKYVWDEWPIEMAQKTAIKWAASRGSLPIDSPEIRTAMQAESRDFIDAEPENEAPHTAENVAAALGLEPQEAPDDHQLPDHGEIDTIDAEPAKPRERVEAKPETKKRSAPKPSRKKMELPS